MTRRNGRRTKRLARLAHASDESIVRIEQQPVDDPKRSRDGNRTGARATQCEHRGGNGIRVRNSSEVIERKRDEVCRLPLLEGPDLIIETEASRSAYRGECECARGCERRASGIARPVRENREPGFL